MSQTGRLVPPLGNQGNVWNAAATGANTNGNIVDLGNCPFVSAFGHVSGAATVTLMLSADGANFYAGPTQVLSGAGDFCISGTIGARYGSLQSTANVTATGTIQAKDG